MHGCLGAQGRVRHDQKCYLSSISPSFATDNQFSALEALPLFGNPFVALHIYHSLCHQMDQTHPLCPLHTELSFEDAALGNH